MSSGTAGHDVVAESEPHSTLTVRTRDDGPDRSQLHCRKCNTYFIRNAPLSADDELKFRQRHAHGTPLEEDRG
jgi:hypothetical protein